MSADQLSLDLLGGDPEPAEETPAANRADPDLRPEQSEVVSLARDYVVTAGAGSGKTRTLVALYSALMEDPSMTGSEEPPGPLRILCLTFTERAARELQRKVRERTIDPRWRRDLESAPISTFHGWCAQLLRRYPLEAGVDPRFAVLSEEAAEDLLRGSAVDALRAGLEQGDEAARLAVQILGLGGAAGALADLVRAIRTAGWPAREPIARFEARLEQAGRGLGPLGADVDAAAIAAVTTAEGARLRTEGQIEALERLKAALAEWREERSSARADALQGAARSAGRYWRFEGHTELREAVIDAAGAWAGIAREIEHRFQLGIWPALAVTVREAYRAQRGARAALDYDDLLLRTRDLLRDRPEVRDEVRSRYRAVLVDEHQDTDPVQDEILRILVGRAIEGRPEEGDPRWCVVGDAKQSIYGFRGATVAAFEALSRDAAGRDARRELATNYRSRPALVEFHNAFFPDVLDGEPGGDRPAYAPQVAFRADGEGPAVEFLDPPAGKGADGESREMEPRALAARIAAACGSGPESILVRTEDGTERTARPGDVVVLLRRLTQVEPYRRALDLVGLESVVVGSGSFWVRQETYDLLNALDAALRPQDPVPLVAFLRSPMAGIPDDEIWRLARGWDREAPLRRHMDAAAPVSAGIDAESRARLDDALAVLDGIVARADAVPPGAVLSWIVDRTAYLAILDALPDRAQRRANVERLIALADRAPIEGHALLSQWAAVMRRRADRPPRDRDASLPEVGDRVRILTIHQAKGLEFPVVAVADLGGRGQSDRGPVRFDPHLGVVAKAWPDLADDPVYTRGYLLAREAAKAREQAEEARLLYVAATRARDRLLLSAGAGRADWLERVRRFTRLPAAGRLVATAPLAAWADRFRAAVGQAPPLADPGRPVAEPAPAAPGEASARELAAALGGEPPIPAPAAAAREAAAAALERGARGHAALERIPLDPAPDDVAAWLAGPGALPAAEAAALAPYATREILPDLAGAAEVARERPFRLRLPGGGVVVGTIDALWRDPGGACWVGDYKFADADEGSAARHAAQLAVYALAAATAFGLDEVHGRLWYVDRDTRRDLVWTAADLRALETDLGRAFDRLPPREPEPDPTLEDR